MLEFLFLCLNQILAFVTDVIHIHAQIRAFDTYLSAPGAERIVGELHPAGGPRPWSMLCMCTHAPHGPARPREHAAHARTRPLTPKVDILTTGGGRISYRAHI